MPAPRFDERCLARAVDVTMRCTMSVSNANDELVRAGLVFRLI